MSGRKGLNRNLLQQEPVRDDRHATAASYLATAEDETQHHGRAGSCTITVQRVGLDRRGLLWESTATYGGRPFKVRGHYPIRDALRALINGTPGFVDAPWQLVRGGRVDGSGSSVREMAALTVSEDEDGTCFRRDKPGRAAIYGPSAISHRESR